MNIVKKDWDGCSGLKVKEGYKILYWNEDKVTQHPFNLYFPTTSSLGVYSDRVPGSDLTAANLDSLYAKASQELENEKTMVLVELQTEANKLGMTDVTLLHLVKLDWMVMPASENRWWFEHVAAFVAIGKI